MDNGDGLRPRTLPKTMRPLDPLLIQSFPAPPSHIPTTPTSPNPPLSRPPTTPLPPVPGPSRISGHESLLLLSASRSRRSSRMSLASESSRPASPPRSPAHPHSIAFSISEELANNDFLKDVGDEDALLDIAVPPDMPTPRKHGHNESISDIDVRDILEAVLDVDDAHDAPALPRLRSAPRSAPRTLSVADPIDPHAMPTRSFTFPTPRKTIFHDDPPPRSSPSPDISTIISTTPRPVLRSRASSSASGPRSSDLPYVPYGAYGIYGDEPAEDDDDTRSWIDHDEYGKPLPPPRKDVWEKLERQLEGSESDASDSSLDLHTPLPHLMVRHGLLSPRSKLVATLNGRDSVASLASVTSTATNTTKGPLKDARDTHIRRTRHRDGRLLRGGIGLTTGLGWSDSEDEDAPSALTRRLSALNLSRRSSTASLPRSVSQVSLNSNLARSYSSRTQPEADDDGDVDEWGARRGTRARTPTRWSSHSLPSSVGGNKKDKARSTATGGPPTAWSKGRRSARTSNASSRSSAGSSAVTIPEASLTPSPSTASSASSSLLLTPVDLDPEMTISNKPGTLKREKSLPPLPPALRRSPGSSNLGGLSQLQLSRSTGPGQSFGFDTRPRTASASSVTAVRATVTPMKSTPAPTMMSTPRPLRLAQAPLLGAPPMPPPSSPLPSPLVLPRQGDRPAVPVPSVPSYAYSPSTRSPLPSRPTTPGEKPKPRTGTGMVYRSAGSTPSRMRVPSSVRPPHAAGTGRPIAL
ncbi:hypothetical protein D9615_003100 [Tricholomella constricta]|uniref:Uncharacterized protein n=1 Tax=Tricholomella constricta TaxID=117010 RepID=A0A8H5HIY5_9AGAR|nr:hypothetical protein D9615_003100 [Tricholomella constricta]